MCHWGIWVLEGIGGGDWHLKISSQEEASNLSVIYQAGQIRGEVVQWNQLSKSSLWSNGLMKYVLG